MAKTFLKRALGVLIVFDLSNLDSFNNCVHWIREVNKHADKKVCTVIVGNKCDLTENQVEKEKIEGLCEQHEMSFFRTSAKTGENINESFEFVAHQVADRFFKE